MTDTWAPDSWHARTAAQQPAWGDEASLAVGIRSFWWADGVLRFGTGAGITWGSDPAREWDETENKARAMLTAIGRVRRGAGRG